MAGQGNSGWDGIDGMLLDADGADDGHWPAGHVTGAFSKEELQYVNYDIWYGMMTNRCSCITVNISTLL